MNKSKKAINTLLLMSLVILLCSTLNTRSVNAAGIKLNKSKMTLTVGSSERLKVSGTKKRIKWTTSSSKIAGVTSKGTVTAKKAGKCRITARVNGKKVSCAVTVKAKKTSSAEVSAYKKFLQVGAFQDPIVGTGLGMNIYAFAYADTNGDGKKELYIRTGRQYVSRTSVAYFYLVTYKNGKRNLTLFNQQLDGYYSGTDIKYVSREGEEIYYYKNKLAYQVKKDLRTGRSVYSKYTGNGFYNTRVVTPQEFKTWFNTYVKSSSRKIPFSFKNNTVQNRKSIK